MEAAFPLAAPSLLAATDCADLKRAQKNLELLASGPLVRKAFLGFLPHLLEALHNSPDPEMVLNNLERFVGATISRAFFFSLLVQHRNVLDLLLTVLFALWLGSGAVGRGAGEQLQGDFARHTARVREPYEATVGGA